MLQSWEGLCAAQMESFGRLHIAIKVVLKCHLDLGVLLVHHISFRVLHIQGKFDIIHDRENWLETECYVLRLVLAVHLTI